MDWRSLFGGPRRALLEAALARRLPALRWFAGKARTLRTVAVTEAIPFAESAAGASLLLLEVTYEQGEPEHYALPVAFAPDAPAPARTATAPAPAPGGARRRGGPGEPGGGGSGGSGGRRGERQRGGAGGARRGGAGADRGFDMARAAACSTTRWRSRRWRAGC